jgi:hypothetical protein
VIRLPPLPRYKARRISAYTARAAARGAGSRNTGRMLFDVRPQLPVAELHSRTWSASVRARTRAVIAARLAWVRPRLVPLVVATASAFALLGAANYLSNLARTIPDDAPAVKTARIKLATVPPPVVLTIDQGPPAATIILDDTYLEPSRCGLDVKLEPR